MTSKFEPLPDEHAEIKNKIVDLCTKVGYPSNKIEMMTDRDGDLHSNA